MWKWLLQFVAKSFSDSVVLLFPGQLKCMYRQTCCKSGLSSHTRRVSPPLFGIMASEKSLQKLIVQVHCHLKLYAVLRLAVRAIRLLHFAFTYRPNSPSSLRHLKFLFFTGHSKTRHRTSHFALHTLHFTYCAYHPNLSFHIHVPQFALPFNVAFISFTSRGCEANTK